MAALTPEQELQLGSADLRFLLERQGIEAVHQRKLFTSGIDTLDKFSAFATGEPDLFKVLKDEFTLDPTANLKARGQVASFRGSLEGFEDACPKAGRSGSRAGHSGMGETHTHLRVHHASPGIHKISWYDGRKGHSIKRIP